MMNFSYGLNYFSQNIIESDLKILISDVAEDELLDAPKEVKDFVNDIPTKNIIKVELNEESIQLAEKYLEENVVGETSRADCYHIAIATIAKADVLVSWNFKHIVNIQRIHGYNAVNKINSYHKLEIRNPRELIDYENND